MNRAPAATVRRRTATGKCRVTAGTAQPVTLVQALGVNRATAGTERRAAAAAVLPVIPAAATAKADRSVATRTVPGAVSRRAAPGTAMVIVRSAGTGRTRGAVVPAMTGATARLVVFEAATTVTTVTTAGTAAPGAAPTGALDSSVHTAPADRPGQAVMRRRPVGETIVARHEGAGTAARGAAPIRTGAAARTATASGKDVSFRRAAISPSGNPARRAVDVQRPAAVNRPGEPVEHRVDGRVRSVTVDAQVRTGGTAAGRAGKGTPAVPVHRERLSLAGDGTSRRCRRTSPGASSAAR